MFYITTPIPYTNSQPHLGHLLEGVFNDTIARFYRRVYDGGVILTMGLDQHGLKIYEEAKKEGQDPQVFANEQGEKFKKLWKEFDVKYDAWIPTTSTEHKIVAQLVWKKLADKGFIYKKKYKGLYCKGCEDFYAPSQLNEKGECPVHLAKPIEMDEENYFFKLSAFSDQILNFLETADIRPKHVAKEQINFVKSGLNDISISREKSRLPWGIAVPGDDEQVMYVWFEALINYLTGAVNLESIDKIEEFPEQREELEKEIWKDIEEQMPIDLLYASKEIGKFHLVIWTGMLAGVDLALPKRALAHGMINDKEGKKFSKSLGNGVLPKDLVARVGVDGARFTMLHEINIDGDTNFDWNAVIDSYNANLGNKIGNLVMRVTNLVEKQLNGQIKLEKAEKIFDFADVYKHLDNLDTRAALDVVLQGAAKGNELLEETKPWALEKEGKHEQAKQILTNLCGLLKDLAEVISIFLPSTGEAIYKTITQEIITKSDPLFPRVE